MSRRAYEEAKELLREFGGLLGRNPAESAVHRAYGEIAKRGRFDFQKASERIASEPRAYPGVEIGNSSPRSSGVQVKGAAIIEDATVEMVIVLPTVALAANDVEVNGPPPALCWAW